jgi:hypothetical protein
LQATLGLVRDVSYAFAVRSVYFFSPFHCIAQYAGQIADQTIPLAKLIPHPPLSEQAGYRWGYWKIMVMIAMTT